MLAFDCNGMRAFFIYLLVGIGCVDDHLLGGEAVINHVVLIETARSRVVLAYVLGRAVTSSL